jgi:hypothetical protein
MDGSSGEDEAQALLLRNHAAEHALTEPVADVLLSE